MFKTDTLKTLEQLNGISKKMFGTFKCEYVAFKPVAAMSRSSLMCAF